ncbi:uncharacterized protein LOC142776489 isoform X2 [Rhipicephalus microplus]|uniref:uncharacterized protein LOC142776489 isoform X2 n=1 Tax=Rhipicephalus microplus TaxID=6941 RepID=UPI003F6CA5FA
MSAPSFLLSEPMGTRRQHKRMKNEKKKVPQVVHSEPSRPYLFSSVSGFGGSLVPPVPRGGRRVLRVPKRSFQLSSEAALQRRSREGRVRVPKCTFQLAQRSIYPKLGVCKSNEGSTLSSPSERRGCTHSLHEQSTTSHAAYLDIEQMLNIRKTRSSSSNQCHRLATVASHIHDSS